jgi:hypothetical protein
MKLLEFVVEEDLLAANQAELSDTIRVLLYQQAPDLLEKLDYDDDASFLDPGLFYYFLADEGTKKAPALAQTLYGYLPLANRPASQAVQADETGLVYLPRLGYFNITPNAHAQLEWDAATQSLTLLDPAGGALSLPLQPEVQLPGSAIRLAQHNTDLLTHYSDAQLPEPVQASAARNQAALFDAAALLEQHLPALWRVWGLAVREVVLFNSAKQLSLAIITYHGTVFLNVGTGLNSPVFFLDDLAHQGGHVVFNALTLQTDDFLNVPKQTPLNQYTHAKHDERTVYGAFHGLFTYTSILHCLDYCLRHELLAADYRAEALARLGFYTRKFRRDVTSFPAQVILTAEGLRYWAMFASGLASIEQHYQGYLATADYSNQPYLFNYALFCSLNGQDVTV